MPRLDELLEDSEESQAFDADLEPVGFEPDQDSSVVIVEPPIIAVGRYKRKNEMRKMQEEREQS